MFMRDRLWQENRLSAGVVRRSPNVVSLIQRVSATIVHHYRFSRAGDNQLQTACDPPSLFSLENCTGVYYELCASSFQEWLDMRERIRVAEEQYEFGQQQQQQLALTVPPEVESDDDYDVVFSDEDVRDANDDDDWQATVTEYIEGVHEAEFLDEYGLDAEYGVNNELQDTSMLDVESVVADRSIIEGPTPDRHFQMQGVDYVMPGMLLGEYEIADEVNQAEENSPSFARSRVSFGTVTDVPSSNEAQADSDSVSSEESMYSFRNNPFTAVVD